MSEEPSGFLNKYGFRTTRQLGDIELELFSFNQNLMGKRVGLESAYLHFRNVCKYLWPKLIWHEWLEVQIESLCENRWVSWSGCAGSGKTFASALFALVFWLADPLHTTVILTSTTSKMVRKRIWAAIQTLVHSCAIRMPGNLVDSKTTLQAMKGDDKNAIYAQAVAEGNTTKAVSNIKGVHNKRVLVIVDEAPETPEAIMESATNLHSATELFTLLAIGNPTSHMDPHGRFSEPLEGWQSVTVDDQEWKTVVKLDGNPGVCLRFDGERSPNITAGRTVYPFLISEDQIIGARRFQGENHPLYWKEKRGFWAPEGLVKTIFTESIIAKVNAHGTHIFTGAGLFTVGGFDPAFGGGDRPILRFAKCGEIEGGIIGIQLEDPILIKINLTNSNPVHFQLAEQVRRECEKRGCNPENLAVDATGEGGGFCDILARTWSPSIIRVEFGGKPSDLPVSNEDIRPCNQVYDRRVTELWHICREFMLAGQMKGLDVSTAIEFCNRRFDDEKPKIVLETKTDMKKNFGKSPDLADSAVLVVESARRHGASVKNQGRPAASVNQLWERKVRELDQLFESDPTISELPALSEF